ncbi:MAG: hypothetical protein SF066_03335 [Thermoanaerobaculia bacterium]|nr:hypothetical protein [Thermoanaerobaculia bacterium]
MPVIFTWTDQLVNSLPLERRAVEARTGVALDLDRGNTNPYFDVFVGHGAAGSGLKRVELRQPKNGASRLGGLVIFDLDPTVLTIDHRQIPARFGPDFAFEPPAAGPPDAPAYYLYRRPWGELRFGWHRGTGRLLVVVIDAA